MTGRQRKTANEDWPRCSGDAWDGQCRSAVAPAAIVAKGQRAEPHPSGLCPSCLKREREAEEAALEPDETESPPVFAWDDSADNAGKPWRERLRTDFDREDVYDAFRNAIVSGLQATRGVSKNCKCGRSVHVTLPDAAQITRAAKDILTELEGVQKETTTALDTAERKARNKDMALLTNDELSLLAGPINSDQAYELALRVIADHDNDEARYAAAKERTWLDVDW